MKNMDLLEANLGSAVSQTSHAYARLRADIVSGRYGPDERLKITELAQSLGVSPGAIREALSRLVPEQLVVSRDQKGFLVAPLSIEDLQDLTDLRCEIETVALRRAVERGDDAWEAGILAAAHRMNRCPRRDQTTQELSADWIRLHANFHAALVSGCGSRRLLDLHAQLFEQSERYRGLSAHVELDRDVAAEHQEIVNAALERDVDLLVELVTTHLRETTTLIVSGVEGAEP